MTTPWDEERFNKMPRLLRYTSNPHAYLARLREVDTFMRQSQELWCAYAIGGYVLYLQTMDALDVYGLTRLEIHEHVGKLVQMVGWPLTPERE